MAKIYYSKRYREKNSRIMINIKRVQRSPALSSNVLPYLKTYRICCHPTPLVFTMIYSPLWSLATHDLSDLISYCFSPLHFSALATLGTFMCLNHTGLTPASGHLLFLFSFSGRFSKFLRAHPLTLFMSLLKYHLIREAFLTILSKRAAPTYHSHFSSHLTTRVCH